MDHDNFADDAFLFSGRRQPPQAFAAELRARLRQMEATARPRPLRAPLARWAAAAASIAAVSLLFTLPSVRAGAAAFFDFFRVKNFTAVAFEPERLREIGTSLEIDVDFFQMPGPGTSYAQLAEAGSAAGIRARAPTWLPYGWSQKSVTLSGGYAVGVRDGTLKLRPLLDALGIDDFTVTEIEVPQFSARVAPLVQTEFENDAGRRVSFIQSRVPDVRFSADLDLAALAEVVLRILGLDRNEAYRFAQGIDWRTTFVVPVPTNAGTFRKVDIQGNAGLLIETTAGEPNQRRPDNFVLWSDGEQVYLLRGALRDQDLLTMAQSMQ
jgi:hypothetical protein